MDVRLETAATHLEAHAAAVRSGDVKAVALIVIDTELLPSYTLFIRGDTRHRLIMIGALHDAIEAFDVEEEEVASSALN